MNLKNFRNGFLALLGVGACFLTYKPEAPPASAVVAGGPPNADTAITLSCKDEVKMFQIFPGPLPYPEIDTDMVEIKNLSCVALNLQGGLPFNGLCAEGFLEDKLGNSCNNLVNPKPTCVMQFKDKDSTVNITGNTKHGTVVNRFWVNYVWVTKSMMARPDQNKPNAPKWLVAELYDANWNLKAIDSVNVDVKFTKDSSGLVEFVFNKYFDANKGFHILVYGTNPIHGWCNPFDQQCNPPIWEFYGFKIEFLCSALGNFCQWGPAKKVWEETNGCERIVYYEWNSSCGEKYVAKYIFTDFDAPLVANKPKDVTIYVNNTDCEAEYFVPAIQFDDCDKNASVFIHTDYGDIRGNGGYIAGIRVQIKKFEVIYTITDGCGNQTISSYWVNVKEDNSFNIVCEKAINTSLNSDSCSRVYAESFFIDMVSLCCGYTLTVKRLDTGKEGKYVELCCNDVGKTIQVCLQARSKCDTNQIAQCFSTITLQDKSIPRITCPRDITVACDTFDILNLSKYGKAVAYSSCGVSLKDTFINFLTMCNVGTVVRTFTATASNGNTAICSQTITIIDGRKFDESNIKWPRDTVFWDCHANYGPDRGLYPKFDHVGCSKQIAWSYIDEVFNFRKNGKCKGILRTWKVIDWCNFNPKTGPYWTHLQIIEVMDSTKPVITFCPKDTSIANYGACNDSVVVNLESVTAIDCGGILKISNDSKYSFVKGANASGKYPNGVHKVVFTVYDSCGTTSTCSMNITVSDKKAPSLILLDGLATDIQDCPPMGLGAKVILEKFIKSFSDNCCKNEDIKFSFFKDTIITEMLYPCDSLGWRNITVYAFDCYGNYTFVKTKIHIQDNFKRCPTAFKDTLMVAGVLQRPNGSIVEDVKMTLDSTSMICSGSYKFDSLAPKTHKVSPFKDDDPLFGVSTRDIVKIQRYVLGKDTLSPYQMIAADVNHSGSVTASDISEIRKLILGINPRFQNNNSWRFVPQSFVFPSGSMTWNFPEFLSITYGTPPGDVMNADFFGIKIGDVDGSANNSSGDDEKLSSRSSKEDVEIEYQRNQILIDAMKFEISVHPNPTGGVLFIDLPKGTQNAKVSIISSEGIETRVLPVQNGDKLEVSLEKYPSGVYIISVITDVKKYQAKVLKL